MTAKVISFGIQKGGCGKSTTTGIVANFLLQDGYRVLVIDMDSQGNTTEMLTGEVANDTLGKSVLEAIYERDPRPYIQPVKENLDVLGSNNILIQLVDYYYTGWTWDNKQLPTPKRDTKMKLLRETLEVVREDYDYILIDTPPNLGIETTNSLYASDWVVVMYECSKFCYSAVPNFLETVEGVILNGNVNLQVAGIVRTLNDARRIDMTAFSDLLEEDYPELVFPQIIKRSAAIGRISMSGFEENPEIEVPEKNIGDPKKDPLAIHREWYTDLMNRMNLVRT